MPTRSLASRFDSGSSMRNACGCRTIARPMATRWRCPPESCAGLRSSRSDEVEQRRDLLDPPSDLGLRHSPDLQAVAEVLANAHVRIQRVALEDHRDVSMARREIGHVAPADRDLARRHLLEPGDRAKERRLAAARRPDERDELAVADLERDVVDGDDVPGEHLADVSKLDLCHGAGYGYHISAKLVLTTSEERRRLARWSRTS